MRGVACVFGARPGAMVMQSHLSRLRKQELIRTPWVSPVIALNCAVAFIQARARGIFVRPPGVFPRMRSRGVRSRRRRVARAPAQVRKPLPKKRRKRLVAGTGQLDRYMDARAQGKRNSEGGFSEWCGVKIQSIARMRPRSKIFKMQMAIVGVQLLL